MAALISLSFLYKVFFGKKLEVYGSLVGFGYLSFSDSGPSAQFKRVS